MLKLFKNIDNAILPDHGDTLYNDSINEYNNGMDTFCDDEMLQNLIDYLKQPTRCGRTIGELVLMALKISIVNHLSHQATIHILKSYCIICMDERIPFNEYKLRKIVSIFLSSNTKYHFLCIQCSNHIFDSKIVPKQSIVCDVCFTNNDLDTLLDSQFFITFDLSSTIFWLMKKNILMIRDKRIKY